MIYKKRRKGNGPWLGQRNEIYKTNPDLTFQSLKQNKKSQVSLTSSVKNVFKTYKPTNFSSVYDSKKDYVYCTGYNV